jgi:integrase
MVLFAAATGLRPGEWLALEHRDVDREAQVVYVRRSFRNGRLKTPKTKASVRAVPLQAIALAALDELQQPEPECPLLFPSANGPTSTSTVSGTATGGRHRGRPGSSRFAGSTIFGTRSRPSRFVPVSPPLTSLATWELSLAMIDRHYGHLARDGREHAIKLLDTYRAARPLDVHVVNAGWTLNDVGDATADNAKGG